MKYLLPTINTYSTVNDITHASCMRRREFSRSSTLNVNFCRCFIEYLVFLYYNYSIETANVYTNTFTLSTLSDIFFLYF